MLNNAMCQYDLSRGFKPLSLFRGALLLNWLNWKKLFLKSKKEEKREKNMIMNRLLIPSD